MQEVSSESVTTLNKPAARTQVHIRSVEYRGYHREDGLWDIEAQLTDTKTYAHQKSDIGVRQAGELLHGMVIRLTVDDEMRITDINVGMRAAPFAECQQAKSPMTQLIGCTLGRGWRKAIEERLGGIQGCAHLRELLFNMATVAFQTIPQYLKHLRQIAGQPEPQLRRPPAYVGQCIAWDFKGSVVKRVFPEFAGWKVKKD